MAQIDSLDIKISAEVNTANAALETLAKKLDRVSASLSGVNSRGLATLGAGVNKLSNAMNNFANNTKTADFSRLSRNLGAISDIDTGKFSDLSSKMSQLSSAFNSFGKVPEAAQQIGDFAKNIAKLGNKSVQTAIDNIPKLAVAMDNLMRTLSNSPKVGQNIIDMTKALAALASQGGKVGTASSTMAQSLNQYSVSASKASKHTEGLASKIGRLYATYFWVIRGIKKLWGSIESSFDYLEVLNYFDAAFGQVAANADLSAFEKMGYESADAYYGSFAKRAEEVTRKMSGFTIGENGLLQSTGAVSLGLDPSKLMNYQAMFGQMSSSMGVASETALKLSQALTEIGADLASVKNLEFETVWNDMASGLAGMSRTLDKYGVNIRNVNLQQKLMELGIDANIQSLNQNNKALLRAIILLENTKYAWGDLADTINQPANQLRLIQANFENLSRTIGNLFLPIVKNVLPYVNALVIAVQRLFAWLGNLIGIDISDISTSIGGADMGDILDQTDDLTSGLGDAKKQADKLNKSLRQFDELKVINTKQDEGAGAGAGISGGLLDAAFEDAFSKYQQVWDEAFGNLENRAQEIADKIEKAFEPIKKIIQDFAIGDFFQAGKDVSALVVSITDFFAEAIDRVNWYGIGRKIGDFLAGIDWLAILKSVGNLIWQALKAAFELYVGAFSSAPLETALVSLVAFPKLLKAITASKFITGIGKLWKNFKTWGEKIQLVTGTLTGNNAAASGLAMLYPELSEKVDGVKAAFSNFFSSVKENGFWKAIDGGITNIRNNLGGLQKAAIVAIAGFAEFSVVSDSVEKLTLGTENWIAEIGKIAGVVAAAGAAMYVALGPAGLAVTAIVGVVGAIKGINDAFDTIRAQEIGESIKNAMSNPGGVAIEDLANGISDAFSNAASGFSELNTKSSELTAVNGNIKSVVDEIDRIKRAMDLGVESVEGGKERINTALGSLVELTTQKMNLLTTTLLNLYGEGGALSHAYGETEYSAEQVTDAIIRAQYATNEAAQSIYEQMQNVEFGSTEWYNLYIQLQNNARGMENFEKAAFTFSDNINSAANGINWDKLIGSDGKLNETYLKEILGNVSTSLDEYTKVLNESEQQTKLYWNEMLTKAATPEDKAIFQSELENVEKQFEDMRITAKWQVTQFTSMLQADYIGKTAQVISEADQKWAGALGQGKEGTFIKQAVDTHYTEFGKLQSAIKGSFSELQETGVAEAKNTMETIYGALFSEDYSGSFWRDLLNPDYLLNEGWESTIGAASNSLKRAVGLETKVISDSFIENTEEEIPGWAAYSEEGLAKAVEERVPDISKTGDLIGDTLDKGARGRLGIKSPSTVFAEIGMYTVLGFNEGITKNKGLTINTITSYMEEIKSIFSNVFGVFEEIGKMAMQGFENGMSQMEWGLYDKANSIADNITQTVKSALDIHSPSRVMFELGDYTMQGFKEGMENLYNPITDSIRAFSYDVSVAPAPSFSDMYGGYVNPTVEYTPQYGGNSGIAGMSETTIYNLFYNATSAAINNSKLMNDQKDMIEGILKKPTIEGEEIGKMSVKYIQGEERRLQKSLVGTY